MQEAPTPLPFRVEAAHVALAAGGAVALRFFLFLRVLAAVLRGEDALDLGPQDCVAPGSI